VKYHLRRGVGLIKFLENGSRPQPPTSRNVFHWSLGQDSLTTETWLIHTWRKLNSNVGHDSLTADGAQRTISVCRVSESPMYSSAQLHMYILPPYHSQLILRTTQVCRMSESLMFSSAWFHMYILSPYPPAHQREPMWCDSSTRTLTHAHTHTHILFAPQREPKWCDPFTNMWIFFIPLLARVCACI